VQSVSTKLEGAKIHIFKSRIQTNALQSPQIYDTSQELRRGNVFFLLLHFPSTFPVFYLHNSLSSPSWGFT